MSGLFQPTKNLVRRVSTDLLFKPKHLSYKESLLNIPETKITVLDNGMKVATNYNVRKVATIGIFINSGSRYESLELNGTANLLERLAFKATKNRSQLQFEKEAGNCGIRFNSYTTRDITAFFAHCLKEYLPKAVELLSDIIQYSANKEEDIGKEKKLILHELEHEMEYQDIIFDYLHTAAFKGKGLGQSVMGTPETIKNIKKEDIDLYRQTHFKPGRMVLAGVGCVEHNELVELSNRHFNALSQDIGYTTPDLGKTIIRGSELIKRNDDLSFAHGAIGLSTIGHQNPSSLSLKIASNLVGSWDSTYSASEHNGSKLAQLAFNNKYCVSYQSFNIFYEDIGLWGIYYACDRKDIYDFTYHLTEEWNRICCLTSDFEVQRAINIFRTNMFAELATSEGYCDFIGKQLLQNGRMLKFDEFEEKLESFDAYQMKSDLMEYVYDMAVVSVGIGPTEEVVNVNMIKSWISSIK